MIFYLLIATLLGLACLLIVRWTVQKLDQRRPQYLWVWRHMERVL